MEEEILQEMIRDRESQLAMIQKKLDYLTSKTTIKEQQLKETLKKYKENHLEQQIEIDQLNQRHSKLLGQYTEVKEGLDMKKQQQGTSLHVYNEIMNSLTDPTASQDSSYITRMQAQLCKAMHSMGIFETQLVIATNENEEVQKYLRDTNTLMVEEKSQVELKLMNDLVGADNLRKEVEAKVNRQNETFTKEKDALVERIEQQQEQGSDQEEEDDEEEKEELTEILVEGREEITRMEQENQEEFTRLEELKQKVISIKGEKLVEEMIAHIEEEFKERQQDSDSE
jgi:hypothetical protein